MKVTLNSPISLGNQSFNRGTQDIPDHLYANVAFKKHVKSGVIVVHPRDGHAQKAQASKDARAMSKSLALKESTQAVVDARKDLLNNKQIEGAGVDEPSSVDDLLTTESDPVAISEDAVQEAPASSSTAAQATGEDI